MPAISQALVQFVQQAETLILPASLKAAGAVLISLSQTDKADEGPTKAQQFQQSFLEKLRAGFSLLGQQQTSSSTTNDSDDGSLDARIQKYSLLGKDELEAQIAVERFSRQIFEQHQVAIAKLTLR